MPADEVRPPYPEPPEAWIVMVVCAVTEPALLVAVRVYVVVFDGFTETDPDARLARAPTPLSIESEVAPVTDQERI